MYSPRALAWNFKSEQLRSRDQSCRTGQQRPPVHIDRETKAGPNPVCHGHFKQLSIFCNEKEWSSAQHYQIKDAHTPDCPERADRSRGHRDSCGSAARPPRSGAKDLRLRYFQKSLRREQGCSTFLVAPLRTKHAGRSVQPEHWESRFAPADLKRRSTAFLPQRQRRSSPDEY